MAVAAAASVVILVASQRGSSAALEDRYAQRTSLAAAATGTYAAELMDAEHRAATAALHGDPGLFDSVVTTFGFTNAVLLDDAGRLLAVHPAKPSLIGTPIANSYRHLSEAVGGTRAISPVVAGASNGEPVVGFAVPFSTPTGRRVFSGAYAVRSTPLQAYLESMVSLPTARFFLVDDENLVLASSVATGPVRPLRAFEPALARAFGSATSGHFGDEYFVSSPVMGTPWTVIGAISRDVLLRPVNGPGRYVPWAIFAMLIVTAIVIFLLMLRRSADHSRLIAAYATMERLAHCDALTGAHTRRSTLDRLTELHTQTRRDRSWLSVIMVDVDRFKRINDTFGHQAGDDALVAVASQMRAGLRQDDVLGRWGGEEFLVLLPDTDATAAAVVAEHIRQAVASEPITLGTGGDSITVSVSLGVVSAIDEIPEVLINAADRAMYAAKTEGRNRVRSVTLPVH